MITTARFMGRDISAYVTSWGSLEQIKDVLLAKATFMTSEMEIECDNTTGIFTANYNGKGMVGGANWYGTKLEIYIDGITQYQGLVKNIKPNITDGTCKIKSENILRRGAETQYIGTLTGVNPAYAMLAILQTAYVDDYIDIASFWAASSADIISGNSVTVTYVAGDNKSVLGAVQDISDIASIPVFVVNNRITARPFREYQGDKSGLKFSIDDDVVREWGEP